MAISKNGGGGYMTREEFFGGAARRIVELEINGKKLRLRRMTGLEMLDFEQEVQEQNELVKAAAEKGEPPPRLGKQNLERIARIICEVTLDEKGERFFEDSDVDRIMSSPSWSVLQDAFNKVNEASQTEAKRAGER